MAKAKRAQCDIFSITFCTVWVQTKIKAGTCKTSDAVILLCIHVPRKAWYAGILKQQLSNHRAALSKFKLRHAKYQMLPYQHVLLHAKHHMLLYSYHSFFSIFWHVLHSSWNMRNVTCCCPTIFPSVNNAKHHLLPSTSCAPWLTLPGLLSQDCCLNWQHRVTCQGGSFCCQHPWPGSLVAAKADDQPASTCVGS